MTAPARFEIIDALADALAAAGQPVDHLEVDGRLHRYSPDGKRKGRKPCWYRAFQYNSGHIDCSFGDWREGVTHYWRSWEELDGPGPDPAERQRIERELEHRRHQAEAEQARKHQRASQQAVCQWEALATEGRSTYLDRKQVPALGIRYGDGFIAVPMRGPDGRLRGLQRIHDNGSKRFTAGMEKRGAFHLIGGPIDPARPLYVAEGYATAASIHLATEAPVVVCFDAGNLAPVVAALRLQHPRQALVIAGDNDQWKAAEPGPQGHPKGNPGREKAHAAGREHNALVALPSFEGLDASSRPTDYNDLHLLAGLEAVRQRLQAAITPEPAPLPTILPQGGYRAPHRLVEIDKPHLAPEDLDQPGAALVESHLASGKTTAAKHKVDQARAAGKRVLYIAPRQSLCGDAARRLELADYRDFERVQGDGYADMQAAPALAICLPSLPKLTGGHPYDLVIIDEAAQVTDMMVSQLVRPNRLRVWDALGGVLATAGQVVALDGTMDSTVVQVLEMARPGERFTYVRNTHRPHQGKAVNWYESRHQLRSTLAERIRAGENLFVTTDSRAEAERIHQHLAGLFPEATGQVIHGQNSATVEARTTLADINGWVEQERPRWLVVSPSVSTGVSIDGQHFTRVVGFFEGQDVTSGSAYQQLRRVRHPRNIDVWGRQAHRHLITDPRRIHRQFLAAAEAEAGLLRMDWSTWGPAATLCVQDDRYEALWAAKRALHNTDRNDFTARLRGWMVRDGFEVRVVADPAKQPKEKADSTALADIEEVKGAWREARQQAQAAYVSGVMEAAPSLCATPEDRERIQHTPTPTDEERRAAIRYDVADFNGVQPHEVTEDMVVDHQGYELPRQVKRLALASLDDEDAQALARHQIQDTRRLRADLSMEATRRALLRSILKRAGIGFDQAGALDWNGTPWSEATLQAAGLAEYLREHADTIGHLEGFPAVTHPPRSINTEGVCDTPEPWLTKYLGTLLRALGLRTTSRQIRQAGRPVRTYSLDTDQLARINHLTARQREKLLAPASVPAEYLDWMDQHQAPSADPFPPATIEDPTAPEDDPFADLPPPHDDRAWVDVRLGPDSIANPLQGCDRESQGCDAGSQVPTKESAIKTKTLYQHQTRHLPPLMEINS